MGYLIAVDTSLSMGRAADGGERMNVNGVVEKSRFELAAEIVESLLQLAGRLNVEPVVHLFRIGETYVNLGEVSSVEDVVGMLTKDDGKDVELFGCTNVSRFMAFTHERLNPTIEDKLIILTDCSTFLGDVNYGVGCETRFIIVNSNKSTMSEMQMEELDEIAASSVGHEASPENESLYHHFFLADFPSIHELSSSVFEELFEMSTYTLEMGHLNTQMRIGHTFHQQGVETISVVGFLRPTALMNMETTGSHFCHPVFYEEPHAAATTTTTSAVSDDDGTPPRTPSRTPTRMNSEEEEETDSEEEYTEIEEEVTDDEEEGEVKDDKPRSSFIPSHALSTNSEENRRIDIGGITSSTSQAVSEPVLADFVPPTASGNSSAPPKRKYKVVSRSGAEKEYVTGAASSTTAPEPVKEEKAPSKKKVTTPPPVKKTKKIKKKVLKKRVPKKKKDSHHERQQKFAAARARAELYITALSAKKEEEQKKNGMYIREEFDRDDVAVVIAAKDEGDDSEDCWSVREGEYSDTETHKKVREEIREEERAKKEKKEEDNGGDVEMKDEEEKEKLLTPFQPSRKRRRRRRAGAAEYDFSAPFLVQILTEAMRHEDMAAVCVLDNAEYAILTVDQNSDGDDLLVISTILNQDIMPSYIPQFAQLSTIFDETNDVDNAYLTQSVGSENPSYVAARSSWFDEDGIEADMVRIRKNLKKIPDRIPHFYLDVNRMRNHAYCVCFHNYLPELADQLIGEAKDFGEAAVKHAEYVATFYRKVIPFSDVKEIPMPNWQ
ncbi:hypothetical protein PMAYCL1PPCAC_31998 [Pristionchus mayeri]|uniref:Integrator complex subunit 14 C-terminal domain-containing protein n=1 Tax=Pristionchus mayeri TaxID=1317129 RepID=A0AAN5DE05_9BILA|nr:hypothetical protein PMAYCL1PPCAC_31998 [Pristionchus mayeri]